MIEQSAPLLRLTEAQQYAEHILVRAARDSEENDRVSEAIRLYNLAGDYATVVACLATAIGNTVASSGPDEKARDIERTASEILHHYERTNRAVGKNRDAVVKLLKIREAMEAKANGKPEIALELLESTNLVPLGGDMVKITKRAEEFKELHESVQRNLQVYLSLTMDTLAGVHQKVKSMSAADTTRQMVCISSLLTTYQHVHHAYDLDTCFHSQKVEVGDGVCGYAQVSHVTRCVLVSCATGRGNCALGYCYVFLTESYPLLINYGVLSLCGYELLHFLFVAAAADILVLCLVCFWVSRLGLAMTLRNGNEFGYIEKEVQTVRGISQSNNRTNSSRVLHVQKLGPERWEAEM